MTGKTLQKLRRAQRLSVQQLAEKTGDSPRTIDGWEQGRPMPPAKQKSVRIAARERA